MKNLLPLMTHLKACPTQDERISQTRLIEMWSRFKQIAPERGDLVTPAMLVGLILYGPDTFGSLLPFAEREQLVRLCLLARERYQQLANPPNKLGKLIAASLKESL